MAKKYTVSQKVIDNAKRAGKLGGRPRGSKSVSTIEKEAVAREIKASILRMAGSLLQSQAALAKGLSFLYRIKTYKGGKRSKPMIVKDTDTIERYLAGELDNDENEYFFMATERPNNQALDSLFDRALGKAVATVELTGKDGADLYRPSEDDRDLAAKALEELGDP